MFSLVFCVRVFFASASLSLSQARVAHADSHLRPPVRRAALSALFKDLHRLRALLSMREHVWRLIHRPAWWHKVLVAAKN
jgi:hypothetical protein